MPNRSGLADLLARLDSKRRAEADQAAHELSQRRSELDKEFLRFLAGPEPDARKEAILRVVLEDITPGRLKGLSFILRHPDARLREMFAMQIGELGTLWSLPFVARAMKDPERWVRKMAAIGLRNRAQQQFTDDFARSAGNLLAKYIKNYPDDKGAPRYDALKAFCPEQYARIEARMDKEDALRPIFRSIYDAIGRFRTYKGALASLGSSPSGYRYLFALNHVDADIRNGGIYQLYSNSTWHLMPDAIEGANSFGCRKLGGVLKEIVYYYHRDGRSKLRRKLPQSFFDNMPSIWNKSLGQLEDEYYHCFAKGTRNVADIFRRALKRYPTLFAS